MVISKTDMALTLDRRLFGMLLYAACLLKPFVSRFRTAGESPVREVVVSKYVGLGSLLLTQKMLAHIRRLYPQVKVTLLTFDTNEPLLKLMGGFIDRIQAIRSDSPLHLLTDTVKAICVLRARKVDVFFDIEFFSRYSAFLCFFSGARRSTGFESMLLPARTALYSHPVKYIAQTHISENFTNHLRQLGCAVGTEREDPRIGCPEESLISVRSTLEKEGLVEGGYFIFNPSASDALGGYRKWSAESWAELIRAATAKFTTPIVLTGLDADKAVTHDIQRFCDAKGVPSNRLHNHAGRWALAEYLALIRLSRLFVTVDSGGAHLAAALGRPLVILCGPETPILYGYDRPGCRVIYRGLFCSPCYSLHNGKKVICRNANRCMQEITPEEVLSGIEDVMPHE